MRVRHSNPARPGGGLENLEPRLLFCASTALFADLATGLDAWWRFDDQGVTTVADQSGSAAAHAGTLIGAASVSRHGLCGGSGAFNGGEMNVANHNDINLGTNAQRTIALWFLAEDVDAAGRQLLYEEGGGTRGLNIYLDGGRLVVGGWNRSESNWQGTWLSTGAIASGQWHHVTLTLDGGATTQPGALRGYLDGALFDAGEGSQLWSHSGDVTLGGIGDTRFPDGTTGAVAFIGHLDDFRLYNRALSAYDVSVLGGAFNESSALTLAMEERLDLHPQHGTPQPSDIADPAEEASEQPTPDPADVAQSTTSPAATTTPEHHAAPGTDQSPQPPAANPAPDSGAAPTSPPPTAASADATNSDTLPAQTPTSPRPAQDNASHADPDPPRVVEVETPDKTAGKSQTPRDDRPYTSTSDTDADTRPSPRRR